MPKGETDLYDRPRFTAQQALSPERHMNRRLSAQEIDLVTNAAAWSGMFAGVVTGVVTSALVYVASASSPRFRGKLNAAGKAAIVVTPSAFAFFAQSHRIVGQAALDPASYVEAAKEADAAAAAGVSTTLPLQYQIANAVYHHPFKVIMGCVTRPPLPAEWPHASARPSSACAQARGAGLRRAIQI